MSAARGRVLVLGGKGSRLTSSSVFYGSTGVTRITVDSAALSRRSSPSNPDTGNFPFSVPKEYTAVEIRSTLILLANKLLISSSPSAAAQLLGILEKGVDRSVFTLNDVALDDLALLDFSVAAIHGVSAILDHRSSALSSVADAVAAISCEALRVDVSPFSLLVSGAGTSDKDAVAVASDFKVFFNGSKLVSTGNTFSDPSVADIPLIHGSFREVSRWLHSKTRIQLNSSVRVGLASNMRNVLLSLACDLVQLGRMSAGRAELLLANSIADVKLGARLSELKSAACPRADVLVELLASSQSYFLKKDNILFMHSVYELMVVVEKIVLWEGIVAFVSLEGSDIFVEKDNIFFKSSSVENVKKKVVFGKGTTALLQFIKDRLLGGTSKAVLENFTKDFSALLDPLGLGFDDLLTRLKEIVESNESRRVPKVAKGTHDISGEQMAIRLKAESIALDVFKRHGAMALRTPVFEMRETLMGKYGEDSKLIYDLADQGGELCSLRYDLTVPFARFVATNGLTSYKRYQIGNVYRRDNPSKGRHREFCQCDFDIAGQFEKMGPDFEVIKVLTELLDELHVGEYEVKLNHRKLLNGMLAICGVPQEKFRTISSSIDKLDKQTFEEVKKEMVEEKGLTVETADKIGTFVEERGSPVELLSKLKNKSEFLKNTEAAIALNELEILFRSLAKSKCVDRIVFDLSLARGLDYYTGVIFEAIFKGDTQVGSIAGGGRYDNMIGMFGKKQVPAVGLSLGMERVCAILDAQNEKDQGIRATETQVLVSYLGDDLSIATELASELWDKKLKAEFMVNKRLSKHIDRARGSKIPYMVIVGEQELRKRTVKLKDIEAATDEEVPRSGLLEKLQDVLK